MTSSEHPNVGRRIRLIRMGEDPDPIEAGTEGVVTRWSEVYLGDIFAQVTVEWDNGRNLMLCIPQDNFEFLS